MICFSDFNGISNPLIVGLQVNVKSLARLDPAACIRAYGSGPVSNYGDVLLVTNESASNNILRITTGLGGTWLGSDTWVCDGSSTHSRGGCDVTAMVADAANWRVPGLSQSRSQNVSWGQTCANFNPDSTFLVDHCLAKRTPEFCSVYVAVSLLAAVTACNALKLLCMLISLRELRSRPLMTLGDAVQSFLEQPDCTTVGFGLLEAANIEKWTTVTGRGEGRGESNPAPLRAWRFRTRPAFVAISLRRWIWCNMA